MKTQNRRCCWQAYPPAPRHPMRCRLSFLAGSLAAVISVAPGAKPVPEPPAKPGNPVARGTRRTRRYGNSAKRCAFPRLIVAVPTLPTPHCHRLGWLISGFLGLSFFAYRGRKTNSAAIAAA